MFANQNNHGSQRPYPLDLTYTRPAQSVQTVRPEVVRKNDSQVTKKAPPDKK